jgi:hypothetical protein
MVRPGRMGELRPYQLTPKLLSLDYLIGFLPSARITTVKVLMVFNQHICAQKWCIDCVHLLLPFRDLFETSTKGVRERS